MSNWFTDIVSGGMDKIITSAGNAIDKLVTSDEERIKLQNELVRIKLVAEQDANKMQLEADAKIEDEVTKRWQSDSNGDEPIAKKVRPFSLIYLLVVVSLMAFFDGNAWAFTIKNAYIDLFQALLMLVFGAYFGSRGLEKIYQIKNNKG